MDSSNSVSEAFNKDVVKEFALFDERRGHELKMLIATMAQDYVDFFQHSMDCWKLLLTELQPISTPQ